MDSFSRRRRALAAFAVIIACAQLAAGLALAQPKAPEPSFWLPVSTSWLQAFEAPPLGPPAYDTRFAYVALRDNRLVAVNLRTGVVAWTLAHAVTSPPAALAGAVFVADGGTLVAVDGATGKVRWTQPIGAPCAIVPAAGAAGIVVLTEKPEAILLKPADGSVAWRVALPANAGPPAEMDDRRVYIGLANGSIVGIDVKAGTIAWTRSLGSRPLRLTLDGDRLRVGMSDDLAYSLATDSGKVTFKWRTGGDVNGAIVSDDHRVYLASMDNSLTALGRGGDMKWQQRLPSRPVGGPAVFGNVVLLASVAAELRLFFSDTGTLIDTLGLPGRPIDRPYVVPPAGAAPPMAVMLTAGGQLFAMSPQGEPALVPFDPAVGATPGLEALEDLEPRLVPMLYPPGRVLPPETPPAGPVKKTPAR